LLNLCRASGAAVARSDSVKTQSRLRLLEEKMNLLADLQHEEERRRLVYRRWRVRNLC
jgi:hypothetical protein